MKNRILIMICYSTVFFGCLGIFSSDSKPKEEWVQLNNYGGWLSSVYFPNPDTGYAVGSSAVILKTTDGGENWVEQHRIPNGYALYSVHFSKVSVGYASGGNGLFHTANGGETWAQLQVSVLNDTANLTYFDMRRVFFENDTGYILLNRHKDHRILKSTSGGSSWNIVYKDTNDIGFENIHFPNSSTCYAIEYRDVLKSSNGGGTWLRQHPGESYSLYSVHFLNSDTGFVSGEEGIYRTLDGGISWQRVLYTNRELAFYGIGFLDKETGFAVGDAIFKTTDGGANWVKLDYQIPNPYNKATSLSAIHCPDPQTCYTVGEFGVILKYTRN